MRKGKKNIRPHLATTYSHRPSNITSSSCTTREISVQEALDRTRSREVVESIADGSRVHDIFLSYDRYEASRGLSSIRDGAARGVAGPRPPDSWLSSGQFAPHVPTRTEIPSNTVPTLQALCAKNIARHIRQYKVRKEEFAALPFYQKEAIMSALSQSPSGMAGDLVQMFLDPELRILTVENSRMTLEAVAELVGMEISMDEEAPYSGIEERNGASEPVDSWEDLETIDPPPRALEPSSKIHTISISCSQRILALPFTYFLTTHLPNLFSLDISACFDTSQGPSALGILSRKLGQLQYLNIGYCSWASKEVVLRLGWESGCWKWLETLVIVGCKGADEIKDELRGVRPAIDVRTKDEINVM